MIIQGTLKIRPPPELPQSLLGRAVPTSTEAFSCPGVTVVARYHVSAYSTDWAVPVLEG